MTPARLDRYRDGVPVYRYAQHPADAAVSVLRYRTHRHPDPRPHIHEFPAILYINGQAGTLRSGGRQWQARPGDVLVAAAGTVIDVDGPDLAEGDTTGVFFSPDAFGAQSAVSSWQTHPLLYPFMHGAAGGLIRLHVPGADQPDWVRTIAAIESELTARREGFRQAAVAHLTVLLVAVARLAGDVVGDLRRSDEKLLAEVFDVIEQRFAAGLSLSDVAVAVGLTPAYLTTVVRRKTGRTVADWITQRRMTEARRLLAQPQWSIAEVSRAVGYPDPSYFTRAFRREHGRTPRVWRAEAAT